MKIEITEQIRIKIETSWIGRTPTPSNFSSSAHCHLEHMLVRDDGRSRNIGGRRAMIEGHLIELVFLLQLVPKYGGGAGFNRPPVPLSLRRPRCSLLSALSILVFDKEFFLHQFGANVITVIISFWPEFISFAVMLIHNRVK